MKPNGKNICAALKQVRKRVADTNGISAILGASA